jgi:hypothetical protein
MVSVGISWCQLASAVNGFDPELASVGPVGGEKGSFCHGVALQSSLDADATLGVQRKQRNATCLCCSATLAKHGTPVVACQNTISTVRASDLQ